MRVFTNSMGWVKLTVKTHEAPPRTMDMRREGFFFSEVARMEAAGEVAMIEVAKLLVQFLFIMMKYGVWLLLCRLDWNSTCVLR